MTVDDLNYPTFYSGAGSILINIETQKKRFRLNDARYTAFIEFTRGKCGANFIKAFTTGQIHTQVYDVNGSDGLYTLVNSRAVYFKNSKGYDGASSALIQVNKNFPNLMAMTGSDEQFEMQQWYNKKGKLSPLRDSFMLELSGPHLSVAEMGKFYDSCFSPENLAIYFDKTEETDGYRVYDDDMTQCYYESKLDKYIESICNKPAIVNGSETTDYSLEAVLFFSDSAICNEA